MDYPHHSSGRRTGRAGRIKPLSPAIKDFIFTHLVVDESSPSGIRWRSHPTRPSRAGREAGGLEPNGYYRVQIMGKRVSAHRIVWLLATKEDCYPLTINHLDWDTTNNRLENLEPASDSRQSFHRRVESTKKYSQLKFVTYCKKADRWISRFQHPTELRLIHVGSFGAELEAYHEALALRLEVHPF